LRPLGARFAGAGADGGSDEGGREEFEEFCPKRASSSATRLQPLHRRPQLAQQRIRFV
jgi:hypothetical protein